jgi:hypothetical protein
MEVPKGRFVISDVETNGLLPGMSKSKPMDKMHCATAIDYFTGETFEWTPDTIKQYPEWMMDEVGVVGGHNFQNFDNRAIQYIFPTYDFKRLLTLDSLIICKMIWPADSLIVPDMKLFRSGRMPGKYLKRQSLGAWGYRLGNYKGEFVPADGWYDTPWDQSMQDYMVQDGVVNRALFKLIFKRLGWEDPALGDYVWPYKPIWIEHEFANIISSQEDIGVAFDTNGVVALKASLDNQKAALGSDLRKVFGSWYISRDNQKTGRTMPRDRTLKLPQFPDITVQRVGKSGKPLAPYVGPPKEYYIAGSPYCRIDYTEFNPNSRDHLADRLQKLFGWVPNIFNPNGKPTVDEGAIKSLPPGIISDEVRKSILDYFIVTKMLGMVHDGGKSWMAFLSDDERIHGRVDPLGTISSRGSHFNPNLGQVPSVRKDDDGNILMGIPGGFGYEGRSLFKARDGWELTGSDMSSLEFICLGHYLHPLDGGVFSERVCDPGRDAHTEHGVMTGLGRAPTKTIWYAYIYGAGKLNIGSSVGVTDDEVADLQDDKGMLATLKWMQRNLGDDYREPSDHNKALIAKGGTVIKKFEAAITGLKELKEATAKEAARGWIVALDGRKLVIRKAFAALNTKLQGAGAIACKVWIIIFQRRMAGAGYHLKVDYNQVLWVHDEKQIEHRPGIGEAIKSISNEAAKEAGEFLGLKGSFRTESKTGRNWAETH